jgi:hypothetical protein
MDSGQDTDGLAELDFQLGHAVQQLLQRAAPTGLMLSGGLASSALACYARRAGARPKAYSLGLPDADEFGYARPVARLFGLETVELVVTPDELRRGFDETLHQLEAPVATPTDFALAHLARRLRADGLTPLSGAELPTLNADVVRCVAALRPAPQAFRRALHTLMADRLPPAVAGRAPALTALAPSVLLAGQQGRLLAALQALRSSPVAHGLQLETLGDQIASYYAGQPVSAYTVWQQALTLLWFAEVAPQRRPAARQKLVVYTALVGPKERLANPLAELPPGATSDLDLDFVCVTDNAALRSDVWRIVTLPSAHLPPEKLSRRPKALPHEYFPDERYSLYIDNTVTFKRLPQASDLVTARPTLFRAFRHATRVNPEQEAGAVAMLGYDDVGTICNQMAFYAAQQPLDSITPLTTATVLLREHHRPEVKRFGVLWWESILAFSKRDQLSFDFARQHSGAEVEYFEGFTHDNPMIRWQGSLSQQRVKASFDGQRYAWLHRDDPEARRDPKAHFLAHGGGDDAAYLKRSPLLEYVCYTQGSSLGSQVSPRRAMAAALEPLLIPHRQSGRRYLLARVQGSTAPHAFDGEELEAATRALSMLMGPARGTLIDLPAAELLADGKVFTTIQDPYDLVIVLGASGAQAAAALQKLQRLMNPEHGACVLALTSPLTLPQAAACEAALEEGLGASAQSSLHASLHDDEREPLPNTVLGLRWQGRDKPPLLPASPALAASQSQ